MDESHPVATSDLFNKAAIGRSRGWLSTTIHATVDAMGNPTAFHLTPGQTHDLEGADLLLEDTPAQTIIADKGYDSQERMVQPWQDKSKTAVIPSRLEPKTTPCV